MRASLGLFAGAWAGGVLVALGVIAFDSGLEANTFAGGRLLQQGAIVTFVILGVLCGGAVGFTLGRRFDRAKA